MRIEFLKRRAVARTSNNALCLAMGQSLGLVLAITSCSGCATSVGLHSNALERCLFVTPHDNSELYDLRIRGACMTVSQQQLVAEITRCAPERVVMTLPKRACGLPQYDPVIRTVRNCTASQQVPLEIVSVSNQFDGEVTILHGSLELQADKTSWERFLARWWRM